MLRPNDLAEAIEQCFDKVFVQLAELGNAETELEELDSEYSEGSDEWLACVRVLVERFEDVASRSRELFIALRRQLLDYVSKPASEIKEERNP